MAETYQQAIAAAKKRYAERMNESAADVLLIVAQYGKPRATVCKDIAGEEWNKLDHRARALEKTAGQTPDELRRAREKENQRIEESKARAFAKRDPEAAARMIAKVSPEAIAAAYSEQTPRATELERREAAAAASNFVEPLRQSISTSVVGGIAEVLNEVADDLAAVEGRVGKRDMNAVRKAHARVGEEIQVLEYRSEMEEAQ